MEQNNNSNLSKRDDKLTTGQTFLERYIRQTVPESNTHVQRTQETINGGQHIDATNRQVVSFSRDSTQPMVRGVNLDPRLMMNASTHMSRPVYHQQCQTLNGTFPISSHTSYDPASYFTNPQMAINATLESRSFFNNALNLPDAERFNSLMLPFIGIDRFQNNFAPLAYNHILQQNLFFNNMSFLSMSASQQYMVNGHVDGISTLNPSTAPAMINRRESNTTAAKLERSSASHDAQPLHQSKKCRRKVRSKRKQPLTYQSLEESSAAGANHEPVKSTVRKNESTDNRTVAQNSESDTKKGRSAQPGIHRSYLNYQLSKSHTPDLNTSTSTISRCEKNLPATNQFSPFQRPIPHGHSDVQVIDDGTEPETSSSNNKITIGTHASSSNTNHSRKSLPPASYSIDVFAQRDTINLKSGDETLGLKTLKNDPKRESFNTVETNSEEKLKMHSLRHANHSINNDPNSNQHETNFTYQTHPTDEGTFVHFTSGWRNNTYQPSSPCHLRGKDGKKINGGHGIERHNQGERERFFTSSNSSDNMDKVCPPPVSLRPSNPVRLEVRTETSKTYKSETPVSTTRSVSIKLQNDKNHSSRSENTDTLLKLLSTERGRNTSYPTIKSREKEKQPQLSPGIHSDKYRSEMVQDIKHQLSAAQQTSLTGCSRSTHIKAKVRGDKSSNKAALTGISDVKDQDFDIAFDSRLKGKDEVTLRTYPLDLAIGKNDGVALNYYSYCNQTKETYYDETTNNSSLGLTHTDFSNIKNNCSNNSSRNRKEKNKNNVAGTSADIKQRAYSPTLKELEQYYSNEKHADEIAHTIRDKGNSHGIEGAFRHLTQHNVGRNTQQDLIKRDIHSKTDYFTESEPTHPIRSQESTPNVEALRDETTTRIVALSDRKKTERQARHRSSNQRKKKIPPHHEAIACRDIYSEERVVHQGSVHSPLNAIHIAKHENQADDKLNRNFELGLHFSASENGAQQQKSVFPIHNQESSNELFTSKRESLFDGIQNVPNNCTPWIQVPVSDSPTLSSFPSVKTETFVAPAFYAQQKNNEQNQAPISLETGTTTSNLFDFSSSEDPYKLLTEICNQIKSQDLCCASTSPSQKIIRNKPKRRKVDDGSLSSPNASQSPQSDGYVNISLSAETFQKLWNFKKNNSTKMQMISNMPNIETSQQFEKCETKSSVDTNDSGPEIIFPSCSTKENNELPSCKNEHKSRCVSSPKQTKDHVKQLSDPEIFTNMNEKSPVHLEGNEIVTRKSVVPVNCERLTEITHFKDVARNLEKSHLESQNEKDTPQNSEQKDIQTAQDFPKANNDDLATSTTNNICISNGELGNDSSKLHKDLENPSFVLNKYADIGNNARRNRDLNESASNDYNGDINIYLNPKVTVRYHSDFLRRICNTKQNDEKSEMSSPEEITVYATPKDTTAKCNKTLYKESLAGQTKEITDNGTTVLSYANSLLKKFDDEPVALKQQESTSDQTMRESRLSSATPDKPLTSSSSTTENQKSSSGLPLLTRISASQGDNTSSSHDEACSGLSTPLPLQKLPERQACGTGPPLLTRISSVSEKCSPPHDDEARVSSCSRSSLPSPIQKPPECYGSSGGPSPLKGVSLCENRHFSSQKEEKISIHDRSLSSSLSLKSPQNEESSSGPPFLTRISPIGEKCSLSTDNEAWSSTSGRSLSPPVLPLQVLFMSPQKDKDREEVGSAPALECGMSALVGAVNKTDGVVEPKTDHESLEQHKQPTQVSSQDQPQAIQTTQTTTSERKLHSSFPNANVSTKLCHPVTASAHEVKRKETAGNRRNRSNTRSILFKVTGKENSRTCLSKEAVNHSREVELSQLNSKGKDQQSSKAEPPSSYSLLYTYEPTGENCFQKVLKFEVLLTLSRSRSKHLAERDVNTILFQNQHVQAQSAQFSISNKGTNYIIQNRYESNDLPSQRSRLKEYEEDYIRKTIDFKSECPQNKTEFHVFDSVHTRKSLCLPEVQKHRKRERLNENSNIQSLWSQANTSILPHSSHDPAYFQFYGENSEDSESDSPGRLIIRESCSELISGESENDVSL